MNREEIIREILERVVENEIKFNVSFVWGDKCLARTYYDASGQRQCKLERYSYQQGETRKLPTAHFHKDYYEVRRVLSFTNKEDEGKEGAVLFTFDLKSIFEMLDKDNKFEITAKSLKLGFISFWFYEDVI